MSWFLLSWHVTRGRSLLFAIPGTASCEVILRACRVLPRVLTRSCGCASVEPDIGVGGGRGGGGSWRGRFIAVDSWHWVTTWGKIFQWIIDTCFFCLFFFRAFTVTRGVAPSFPPHVPNPQVLSKARVTIIQANPAAAMRDRVSPILTSGV